MEIDDRHLVEREGVHQVGLSAARDLRWVFREKPTSDVGIDGELEPVIDGEASGLIIACQIKSGEGYFRERSEADGVVLRLDSKHVEYWTKYSNPVVVILYRPSDESLLWQVVSGKTVESTGSGWKVVVPHSQRLSRLSREDLLSVARREHEEEVDLGRIRTEVQQPLVVIARSGSRVVVEAVEWVNKTSGRTDLRLLRVDPDGAEATLDWWTNLLGSASVPEAVQRLFPWSEPRIDESYYESCDAARFDEEEGIWDSEEQRQVHFESFSEWARRHLPDGLRPYSEDGEVARWRIVLHVNPISLAHDLASTLPIDHPDRLEWFAALKEAEMNHQAESALYGLAQRLVGRYLGS